MSTPESGTPAPVQNTPQTEAEPAALEAQDESDVEQSDESDQPVTKEEKKAAKRKLKLKVDGEEYEEEVNTDDDQYLTRQLQLAKVAQKRMKEHSDLQKQVQNAFDLLKKDPRKFLSDPSVGIDIKELARSIIEDEVNNSKKTPEQIEREEIEAELRALKEERENEKKSARDKEQMLLEEKYYQEYDTKISSALDTAGLPKKPYVIKKIGEYLYDAAKAGFQVDVKDVMPLVIEDIHSDIKEIFGAMPDEALDSMLGNDVYNRMRKKRVANGKTPKPPVPVKTAVKDVAGSPKKETKEEPKKTIKQMWGI